MQYWLMKSEPEDFSIEDLERVRREPWSGVRNYQARNYLRDAMRVGDAVLFYHSSCAEPGVAGVARVARAAYPDPTQFNAASDYYDAGAQRTAPRWFVVDVAFKRRFKQTITLQRLKQQTELAGMGVLMRGNRLSVMPVEKRHYDFILSMAEQRAAQ